MINEHWAKSTYSTGGDSNCVEARSANTDVVDVRDSQNPIGHLSFSTGEWHALLYAVDAGEL